MPPEETGDSGLGIGPTSPDPAKQDSPPPAPMLAPPAEQPPAESPERASDEPKDGLPKSEDVDWKKIDFRRGKETDVPEAHREDFRRRQKEFREWQAENSRRDEDLRRREEAMERRQRDLDARLGRLEQIEKRLATDPASITKKEGEKAADDIEDILSRADLEDDVREAVTLMDQRIELALRKLKVPDRLNRIDEEVLPRFEKMTQDEVLGEQRGIQTQINEAHDLYGDDINRYTMRIRDALGYVEDTSPNGRPIWKRVKAPWTNDATGQPETVTTLYEQFSGIAARRAAAMREENGNIKDDAKRNARPPAPSARKAPPTHDLSESEARAEARLLGFGPR